LLIAFACARFAFTPLFDAAGEMIEFTPRAQRHGAEPRVDAAAALRATRTFISCCFSQ